MKFSLEKNLLKIGQRRFEVFGSSRKGFRRLTREDCIPLSERPKKTKSSWLKIFFHRPPQPKKYTL